jgi:membrane fusion protein, multidrug efflux system
MATLFDLRARYHAQQGDIASARVAAAKSAADLRRMQALHADDRNVSASALETVQAQNRNDQTRLQQAQAAATGTLDAVRQSWGSELANALRGNDHARLLPRLASRQQVLVQVGVASAGPPPARVWLSTIDTSDTGGKPGATAATSTEQVAALVGPAISTDPSLPATTFLYSTAPGNLRSGARLRVRFETSGKSQDEDDDGAALVPFSAVIWHSGQAWAYVAQGNNQHGVRFERRLVDTRNETASGWVQTERFEPGDDVVTGGAQWMLSKELKPRAIDND